MARLNAAKVACAAANAALGGSCDLSTKVLSMLPFTSVNLTELAEWRAFRQTQSGNNNNISFAAPYYEDDNYDHLFTANNDFLTSFDPEFVNAPPVRGAIEAGYRLPYQNCSGGKCTDIVVAPRISAEIYRSNSGLAVLDGPVNAENETIRRDVQNFLLNEGQPDAASGSYKIQIPVGSTGYTFSGSTSSYPKFTSASITSRCSYATKNSGGNKKPNPFTCVSRGLGVPTAVTTISITKYNYQTTGSVSLSCSGSEGSKTFTGTGAVCPNFQLASVTSSPLRVTTITPPSTAADGTLNETTAVSVIGLANNDSFVFNLVRQAGPDKPAQCTYEMVGTTPVFTTSCP